MLRGEQTTWPPGYLVVTESQCHFCFFGCSFLFSYVFLFCILIKRGERPTWQLAWLRAKVNFVLFSCFYFWICFCFVLYFLSGMFERREQPTWLPGRPSWCDWEPMSLRGWYQTQRRKKSFEFFNFYLLKLNCYECKKWLKERGQTIQIGLPTVGDNYKYKYILQNVSKFITILHQNFAVTQTAFLKPSTSKLHCIFLACFCHLGLNCMHENRTGAVFIHLLNAFALSLQIQYKSSHWVYNCDHHRPALICPDMSPRADKVLCKTSEQEIC